MRIMRKTAEAVAPNAVALVDGGCQSACVELSSPPIPLMPPPSRRPPPHRTPRAVAAPSSTTPRSPFSKRATAEVAKAVAAVAVSPVNGLRNSAREEACALFDCKICLQMASEPVVTICGHLFCSGCLDKYFFYCQELCSCPVCRELVEKLESIKIIGDGMPAPVHRMNALPQATDARQGLSRGTKRLRPPVVSAQLASATYRLWPNASTELMGVTSQWGLKLNSTRTPSAIRCGPVEEKNGEVIVVGEDGDENESEA